MVFLCSCSLFVNAQQDSVQNSIGLSYEHTYFSGPYTQEWKVASLEYEHKTSSLALIGKVNYAHRYGEEGVQFEAQAYPKLGKKVYAFLGASYSGSKPVFPVYTTGATLYISLNNGFEVEGGYRQLNFDKNIWVGTGGISKYWCNWLFNFRSFISIDAPADNQSYFLTAKRFLRNPKEVIWVQIGNGISPDERRNVQLKTANLTSKRLCAGAKFFVWKNTLATITTGYS